MESIIQISKTLEQKQLTIDGALLHSCSSAMFVKYFRPILTNEGVLLSYSAETGSSSNWAMTIKWMIEAYNDTFFSSDALAKPWESGELTTTTAVISTKDTDHLMNLEKSNRGLPDFVDASEESEAQRELVLGLLTNETNIQFHMYTDVEQFNEITVMKLFNKRFNTAILAHAAPIIDSFKKEPILNELFSKIKVMEQYGEELSNAGVTKGAEIVKLSHALNQRLVSFLLEMAYNSPTEKRIREFKAEFSQLAHSKDIEMQAHRAIWKPVVANILLALTGVGFVAIIVKAVAHAVTAYNENKPMTLNQSLFFAKTKSQELTEAIDEAVTLNPIRNPSP